MAKFLVLQAARFGDLVQSKRLVLSLLARGEVHLAVDAGLAELARLLYPGAIIHPFQFHAGVGHADALDETVRTFRRLRALAPDTVYNCNFSGLTGALCRLFAPETVVGYRPAETSDGGLERSPWARLAFRLSRNRCHSPLNLVDFWAHFAPGPVAPALVNPVALPGGAGLGIALAGREARRSLPIPVLAGILTTLFGLMGGPPVRLLGSHAETPAARRLLRLLPPRVREKTEDLSGRTDWAGLVHALEGLDALVTPDTGLMHLGAHLGVPVLAFFLSSAWCHETGPYGIGHTVWQAASACAPCLESAACPRGVACLAPFAREDFTRALAHSLRSHAGDGPSGRAGEAPPGLQCWRSGVDALGGVLHLAAGEDAHARQRMGVRALLMEWLGLPGVEAGPDALEPGEVRLLREQLLPDSEWMLPPGRYA